MQIAAGISGEKAGGSENYVLILPLDLSDLADPTWLRMPGDGVSCLSLGSQERKVVAIHLPESSLCTCFPLKQIILRQDT